SAWIGGGKSRYIRTAAVARGPFVCAHSTMATAEPNHLRRSIAFINWAHAIDHYVMLIFPTVVIGLESVYGRSYSELIALGTPAFLAFGVFSLPAGWLGDRWSRGEMMAVLDAGWGLSLVAGGLGPDLGLVPLPRSA